MERAPLEHVTTPETGSDSTSAGGPMARTAAEDLARTLRAVADPTRLQVLSMILRTENGEVTVGELAEHLGLRQPTVSHHLKIMVADGLLERDARGRNAWFSITPDRRSDISDLLGP